MWPTPRAALTIKATLLARGYLPKELPPSFYSDAFAVFASSRNGRSLINSHTAAAGMECVGYSLAVPGGTNRELRIANPVAFAKLVEIAAKSFGRLLRRGHRSAISRSTPSYTSHSHRAIVPALKPSNLPRERAKARAGAAFILKADVSHFYPTLYTHAVGWAIDPQLRDRAHWHNRRLLGKRLDQALMDLQGKVSQGIPISNDLSFLLAELVLNEVDRKLRRVSSNGFRWYDDYEFACASRADADRLLATLRQELSRFRLRLNPAKTRVLPLPLPADDEWRQALLESGARRLDTGKEMVRFFDAAFRLSAAFPGAPVLLYALGILFKVRYPSGDAETVALSCITQALLAEPGVAQKAFALLGFWKANGLALNTPMVAKTIGQMIASHEATGPSSDISWALFFCIESRIALDRTSARSLSVFRDDATAIQSLHMESEGLFVGGFSKARLVRELAQADPEGDHWLAAYEMVRQGHITNSLLTGHPVFGAMLRQNVPFYRTDLPTYASLLHPGGAPEWATTALLSAAANKPTPAAEFVAESPVVSLLANDLRKVDVTGKTFDEIVAQLFGDNYKAVLDVLGDSHTY